MKRLAGVEEPYGAEVSEDFEKLMPKGMAPLGLFRVLANNPRVLRRIRKGGLLDRGSVSVRERELVILRTTALCRAEYEWGVHVRFFGGAAGFTAEEIAATVSGDRAVFGAREQVLFALCEALHETVTVPDGVWAQLIEAFRKDQVIELVALAGQYRTIAYFTNALAIELEEGAPRFDQGMWR